jgi:hypothetical protein
MTQENGKYYLSGVVSSGEGCFGNGIYTNVGSPEILRWIKETIEKN